jgi:hypothetical protein
MNKKFNFNKFVEDLEFREQEQLEKLKQLQQAENEWKIREKVRKYQEHYLHKIERVKNEN